MKVQNLNCQYIKILSTSYEKNYAVDNLDSVEIEITASDGTVTKEAIDIDTLYDEWNSAFTFTTATKITQIYLKNVFTGQIYPLLASESSYTVNVSNMDIIEGLVDDKLAIDLSISGDFSYDITGSTLTLTFTGLPAYIIPHRVTGLFTDAQISASKYFSYTDSEKYILNGDDILLLPAFFGSDSFTDDVYKVKVSVLDKDSTLTTEEICFFMDCTMSGNLTDTIDIDDCNEPDVSLLMLHYSLKVASNYECDCDKMQSIFEYLSKRLGSPNSDPCGC